MKTSVQRNISKEVKERKQNSNINTSFASNKENKVNNILYE